MNRNNLASNPKTSEPHLKAAEAAAAPVTRALQELTTPRRRLPDTRESITHKFTIAGHEGYLTVGLYEDGSPGEVFIKLAKEGSTLAGLADTIGILTSICLQHGVPLSTLAEKFRDTRFEPAGHTKHPAIPIASSITDYVFRWLELTFDSSTNGNQAHSK